VADDKSLNEVAKALARQREASGLPDTQINSARKLAEVAAGLGPNSAVQRALDQIKASQIRTFDEVNSALAAKRAFENFESSGVKRMLEMVEKERALFRVAAGPLEDLRRLGIVDSPWKRQLEELTTYNARFRLPEVSETARLLTEIQNSNPLKEMLKRYGEETSGIRHAIESMRSPWLDMQQHLHSLAGLAGLRGIGHALGSMPVFGEELTAALRVDLGDWRDRITWPETIFSDISLRSEFYVERGFEPALSDFPAEAFEESLDNAGLTGEPPPLVAVYGPPVPRASDDEAEAGFVRTNMAHDWLQRLESQVRRFIDENMSRQCGTEWPRSRLPNGMYDQWQEKRRKAGSEYSSNPLIAFADFTDYEGVICRKDNWREVFSGFFARPESVRESFQRLYPVRIATMHARIITQDDEVLLYAEVRRLVRAITS
jgi:hypothetical protein